MLLASFSSRFFSFYLIFVGEYYSLSCEPTLGESHIFHSMVKRNIIRTRDAIKFIGDGQEQKLKKDRLIESWIKVTLLYSFIHYHHHHHHHHHRHHHQYYIPVSVPTS